MFSYPYSMVRRLTTVTWSYLWTRGLVNVLPFVRRPAIEDSSSSSKPNRVRFDTSANSTAESSNSVMDSKEELESVVVSSSSSEEKDSNNESTYVSCQSESDTATAKAS